MGRVSHAEELSRLIEGAGTSVYNEIPQTPPGMCISEYIANNYDRNGVRLPLKLVGGNNHNVLAFDVKIVPLSIYVSNSK